jgi:hypothetical protein
MAHNRLEKKTEAMQTMQLKYGHANITTTLGYLELNNDIDSWMGSVALSEGVLAHLADMLRKHDAMCATGPA